MVRPLTISELEQESGVPRSTIYYYVREGLLPPAQKAAASRAIYSDVYVELLGEIARLQTHGAALEEVRSRIQPLIERHLSREPDLVARRNEQTRSAILEAAARHFARKGYKRTRVSDVIRDAGITPSLFSAHFATKRKLFLESFGVFVHWMEVLIEPPLADEPDPVIHLLTRINAYFGLQALSPDLLALARSEALQEDVETREAVKEAYRTIVAGPTADFAALRRSETDPPIPDELVAYSFLGAIEHATMRVTWGDQYSQRDIMLTHLFLYLSVEAAYTGCSEVGERMDCYLPLVDRLLAEGPPVPPAAR